MRDGQATALLRPATRPAWEGPWGRAAEGAERYWQAGDWHRDHPEDDEFSRWVGGSRIAYAADGDPPNEPNAHHPEGLRHGAFAAADPDAIWRLCPPSTMPVAAVRFHLELIDATQVAVERVLGDDLALTALGVRPASGGFTWNDRVSSTGAAAYRRGARPWLHGATVWRLDLRVRVDPVRGVRDVR